MEGSLGGLLTSLVVVCRGHARYPGFALGSSKVAVGFLVFLYLFVHNFAPAACMQLFLVCCGFFVFCCSRRCVSGCKPYSKGSQVPACLRKGAKGCNRILPVGNNIPGTAPGPTSPVASALRGSPSLPRYSVWAGDCLPRLPGLRAPHPALSPHPIPVCAAPSITFVLVKPL